MALRPANRTIDPELLSPGFWFRQEGSHKLVFLRLAQYLTLAQIEDLSA